MILFVLVSVFVLFLANSLVNCSLVLIGDICSVRVFDIRGSKRTLNEGANMNDVM